MIRVYMGFAPYCFHLQAPVRTHVQSTKGSIVLQVYLARGTFSDLLNWWLLVVVGGFHFHFEEISADVTWYHYSHK